MGILLASAVQEPRDRVLAHALEAAEQRNGLPRHLLRSLCWQLSGYDATKRDGARRGALLLPVEAALWVDWSNPTHECDAAAQLIAAWRKRYLGSWAHALAAYVHGAPQLERGAEFWQWPHSVRWTVMQAMQGAAMPRSVDLRINRAKV